MLLEVLILPFFAAILAYGQFTSGVDLVEVYATVTDERSAPVGGLTAADFRVTDEGVPQNISTFAAGGVPVALAVAIDRSFSMRSARLDRLGLAQHAAEQLVGALDPHDVVSVIAVGSEVETAAAASESHQRAIDAIRLLAPWGSTRLYDATVAAIDSVQSAKGRRALVLFSDGEDRESVVSAAQAIDAARRRDVLVYPITVAAAGAPVLAEIAAATGGRSFAATTQRGLGEAVQAIVRELRMQYLLGYVPTGVESSGWHAIGVRVIDRAGLRVRARDGYWGPPHP